ncbi:T9SS type A sorting domain-containing protein, partial [candidate division KSB1 bacterium]|nr:T9SS type A sorting domain-containing protein [candidate division KSB1 bacterium]
GTSISNQAFIDTYDEAPQDWPAEPSDDPDTPDEDDPTDTTIEPGCPEDMVDTQMVLVSNDPDVPSEGRGTLVFDIQARTSGGATIACDLYDPIINVDPLLATLNPSVTFPFDAFAANGNYTGDPVPAYFSTVNQIEFGYLFSGSELDSRVEIDGTWQTILTVRVEYDLTSQEGCFTWDPSSYRVEDLNGCDVTGSLLGSICVTFPVELSSFSASIDGNSVFLEWITESETKNLGFHIYRSESRQGDFNQITDKIIQGAGNSSSKHRYSYRDETADVGQTYYYKLADIDYSGRRTLYGPIEVTLNMPEEFSLEQNYPNPFNPSTTIRFNLTESGPVQLSIFNLNGQRVRTLVSRAMSAGSHAVVWDGTNDAGRLMPSGVYLYKLEMNGKVETRKMEFLK